MGKIQFVKAGSRKAVIISKAALLFRKKGFGSSSMRELAELLGVEAPSLYNHIGSKAELLESICETVAGQFKQNIDTTAGQNIPVAEKLEKIIRFHVRMMLENYDEVYVANHEWKQLADPSLGIFLQQRKDYENRFVDLIKTGIKSNTFHNIDPHVAALTILSAVRGLEFWHRHKKAISTAAIENDMIHHLLKGLMK